MEESYDRRYLAGIVLFNQGDFFEAHEVWELLWQENAGPDQQFYQGLIQAAVGLCHFVNGNLRGAVKLYYSSRKYMAGYPSTHLGLDQTGFWREMEKCFAPILEQDDVPKGIEIEAELIPEIQLDPDPAEWPDPQEYLEDEE